MSRTTRERLDRAARDLEHQKKKHEEEMKTRQELEAALAQNHLAQLMYDALAERRRAA